MHYIVTDKSTFIQEKKLRLLGHRGAKGEAPENTVAGFIYAKNLGLDAFEFDVYLAKDGKLVVIHDPTLERTTNGTGKVTDLTSAELALLDARAGFTDFPLPCGVPTLDQVLDVIYDIPLMQIEIKHDDPKRLEQLIPLLVKTIEERHMRSQVVITSFDTVALQILKRVSPNYPAFSLLGAFDSIDWVDRAIALECTQVNVSLQKSSAEIVAAARRAGLKVGSWVCDTSEDFATATTWNVDYFTCNVPSTIHPLMTNGS